MGTTKENFVYISKWVIGIIILIAGAYFGQAVVQSEKNARTETQIENLLKVTGALDSKKVDNTEYKASLEDVKNALERIENKLDSHLNATSNTYHYNQINKQVNR